MARTHGQVNDSTGKVETRKVGRHRSADIGTPRKDTKTASAWRALAG